MGLIIPKDIINEIGKSLTRKDKLIRNLKRVIDLATLYNHNHVKEWAEKELIGYSGDDLTPNYRRIVLIAHKERSALVEARKYKDTKTIRSPLTNIIKSSTKKSTIFHTTNIWGTTVTQLIPRNSFLQIINGIKAKIREYISKVNLDPNSVKIEFDFIEDDNYKNYIAKVAKEQQAISSGCFSRYLQNDKELRIFKKNLEDLHYYVYKKKYKYVMISKGAILEFLLTRYCKLNNFIPSGKETFYNYLKLAIKHDIFGERKSWELVKTHIRDFRNYVHIQKEITSPEIDERWFKSIKPIYKVLYEKFKD